MGSLIGKDGPKARKNAKAHDFCNFMQENQDKAA
jgi:hypothetical protein